MALYEKSQESDLVGLIELRDMLAKDLDNCESMRDKGTLTARYLDVLKAIQEMQARAPRPATVTPLDEMRKRREARKAQREA